jgi:type I restriction enzyme R subunit
MPRYTEHTLVQETTAAYLRDALGWEVVSAYNQETFGPEGTLGRGSDREVVLTRTLGEKLLELNPGFARNAAIVAAKEAVNEEDDETRKRYEIMAREVFKKFKACLTV